MCLSNQPHYHPYEILTIIFPLKKVLNISMCDPIGKHIFKAKIEKHVQEMLNLKVIQPSTSLFSSPFLLVKKKDGI